MNEMTHFPPDTAFEIRSGGLRPSTLHFPHDIESLVVFLLNLNTRAGDEPAIPDFPNRQL